MQSDDLGPLYPPAANENAGSGVIDAEFKVVGEPPQPIFGSAVHSLRRVVHTIFMLPVVLFAFWLGPHLYSWFYKLFEGVRLTGF